MTITSRTNRYDKYKDSGIEWIGEIPDSWSVKRLKVLASIQTGNTPPKENSSEDYYAEQGFLWVKPDNLDNFNPIKTTNEYLNNEGIKIARVVPANTPLICCIGSIGKFGVSNKSVAFNQQINAILFKKELVNTKFGLYYLSSQEEQHWFYSNGNVVKILNAQNQGKICCTCPSISEQEAIAGYLDRKCGAIDETIEKQKSVIEKLKEYKQSIITQAVTKGLDKSAPMKDSGIEWLGQIPQHWDSIKLKYKFRIKKDIAGEEGFDILSVTQQGLKIKDISTNEGQLAMDYSKYQIVKPSDFVMNHMDLLTGWVDCSAYFGVTSPDYRVFVNTDQKNCNNQYYNYVFQICYKNKIFYGLGQGVSGLGRWRLQSDKFLNFRIPIPPYNEQEQIVQYINKKCSEIDKTIEDKEKLIEKLLEYKKSLIYECVTGKRKVVM